MDFDEKATSPMSELQAKEILGLCSNAHGWNSLYQDATFEVVYIDHWPNFLFSLFFHPWPETGQKLIHTFALNDLYTSQIEFEGGLRAGEAWGMHDKKTFWKKDEVMQYRQHKNTSFYLPTYQYFFQITKWFNQIPMLRYLGKRSFDNKEYHLVFGTWESFEPNEKYDQYLFWINTETYYLEMVQYTIREQMRTAAGTNTFSDFREVNGLKVPFTQTITFNPGDKDVMHKIRVEQFKITWQQMD